MGFRYDAQSGAGANQPKSPSGSTSSGKKSVGLAFNYVAGGETKVAEASRGLKSTSPLPQQSLSPKPINKVEINPITIDYVESAALKQKKEANTPSEIVKSSQQRHKRDRLHGDSGSGSDSSSLEESVEDHKQPQTEEIMNAELIQVFLQLFINLKTYILGVRIFFSPTGDSRKT